MKKQLIVFGIIFLFIAVVCLSGCTINNDNISEDEYTLQISVLSTERMHRIRTDAGYVFPNAEAGYGFFTVEIKVNNVGDNKVYTGLGYIAISDTNGMIYRPSPHTYLLSDRFDNLDILPNKYNQGKILFEIPVNCTVAYFYYRDSSNNISLQISEPESDIPTQTMNAEEIYNEFNSIAEEIDKILFNISLELDKTIQGYETNYTLIIHLGGDIVYLCADYAQDILPFLPLPIVYEEARTEFNSSLLHWGQMGLNYIYYGYEQNLSYYSETITQKNIANQHWVNCTRVLGFT